MPIVCLQAGHERIQNNCDHLLAQGTGAPGEISWTPVIRKKVAALLQSHAFRVVEVDANANCNGPFGPFDLTLAIHYQSNTGHSGFGVFVPDPSVDRDTVKSCARAKAIAKTYAARTKLPNCSSPRLGLNTATWENPNTRFYYLWAKMNGPLALIECGEGAPGAPDHNLLWDRQDKIAGAIAEGICVAFGVQWAPPPVPAPIPPAPVPVPVPPPVPVPDPPPVVPPDVVVINPDPAPTPPPGGWAALIAWLRGVLGIK